MTASLGIAAVFIYGITGFYFLDRKHFLMDFNLWQSVRYTFQNMFLFGSNGIIPYDSFAKEYYFVDESLLSRLSARRAFSVSGFKLRAV